MPAGNSAAVTSAAAPLRCAPRNFFCATQSRASGPGARDRHAKQRGNLSGSRTLQKIRRCFCACKCVTDVATDARAAEECHALLQDDTHGEVGGARRLFDPAENSENPQPPWAGVQLKSELWVHPRFLCHELLHLHAGEERGGGGGGGENACFPAQTCCFHSSPNMKTQAADQPPPLQLPPPSQVSI